MSNDNGRPFDLSSMVPPPMPKLPFDVAIVPVNNRAMLLQFIAKGFEPMGVFVGPILVQQEVEVTGQDGTPHREMQQVSKMDYVCWLKLTTSPLEIPQGVKVPRA